VLRSKYVLLEQVVPPPKCPNANCVASMVAGDMPNPIVWQEVEEWRFLAIDHPEDDNVAHAEVRFLKGEETFRNRVSSKALRRQAQDALARKLRVVRKPDSQQPGA